MADRVALQQRLLPTASPGSLPVPLAALVVSASLFTLSSQIGAPSQGGSAPQAHQPGAELSGPVGG